MNWINGETISFLLFFIGAYGLIARRNMIKSVMSIAIMQAAAILYFLSANFRQDSVPPIGEVALEQAADPLPQALMITEIVIGIGIIAASLTLIIHLYHLYGTTNWLKARDKRIDS